MRSKVLPKPTAPSKEWKDAVRRAISSLKNPPQLAQSSLLAAPFVSAQLSAQNLSDNRLNRITVLRAQLIAQIEALRPAVGNTDPTADAARFFNALYYPYVREFGRKAALAEAQRLASERRRTGNQHPAETEQVLTWLSDIDEDTFYKWQRRASDLIAANLWEAPEVGKER